MAKTREVVVGRIISKKSGEAVADAHVTVYDKDLILDDLLGETNAEDDGRFRVEFDESDYKDSPYEGRPDIYLVVSNPENGRITKSKVFYDLEGELSDDESMIMMDLGDIAVT